MARSGLRTDAMSGSNESRQPGLTRRKLVAGFIAITALVSSVALVAQPEPPPEIAAPRAPIDLTFPDAEAPIVPAVDAEAPTIETVRVTVTCTLERQCTFNPGGVTTEVLVVCRDSCRGAAGTTVTHTLTSGSTDRFDTELPVIRGIRRADPTTREIVVVPASEVAVDDFIRVQPAPNGDLIFEEVGTAGMDITASYAGAAPVPPTNTETPALVILLAGVVILAAVAAGLFALFTLIVALLGPSSPRVRNVDDDDEEEVEGLPVDAPFALAQPVTKEVAQERAEVARDLLDRVRDIDDPRLSIQTGFSLLETGFGRVHLARRRNETSGAYVTRVFGDHEDLRPTMREISQIFERARFSDLPVDAEMRASMIDRLAEVKDTWEQEAFLLSEQVPAPPTVLSSAGMSTIGDQPSAPIQQTELGGDGQ